MEKIEVLGVIPARYGSRRFPGKVLFPILGRPMIEWVLKGAKEAKSLDKLILTSDEEKILEVGQKMGVKTFLTPQNFPSGTHRVAWVAEKFSPKIVVNIQGDEPLIRGEIIDEAVKTLVEEKEAPVVTLIKKLEENSFQDPETVKVVKDERGYALYFSRAPIPFSRGKTGPRYRHIGIYVFRADFLQTFLKLSPTYLEETEKLEQLRILGWGYPIKLKEIEAELVGVDVPEDILRVEKILKEKGGTDA